MIEEEIMTVEMTEIEEMTIEIDVMTKGLIDVIGTVTEMTNVVLLHLTNDLKNPAKGMMMIDQNGDASVKCTYRILKWVELIKWITGDKYYISILDSLGLSCKASCCATVRRTVFLLLS
jgi:hypothetical protein